LDASFLASFVISTPLCLVFSDHHRLPVEPRPGSALASSALAPSRKKSRAQQIIQLFASIGFPAILVVPSLDHRFSRSHVPLWIVLAGDLLVILGFYIVFKVFCVNTFTSATIEVNE
jgi:hypothetical protein